MTPRVGFKRPPVFGEGTVVKRPRTDDNNKPADATVPRPRSAPFGDLFSGSDFHAKPKPKPSDGRKSTTRAFDAHEVFSAFQTTSTETARQARTPLRVPRPPPLADIPVEHHRKMTPLRSCMQPPLLRADNAETEAGASLTSCVRWPGLPPVNPTTPARKVLPFRVLRVPVLESPSMENSVAGLRPLPSPKFDFGRRDKGKMKAMTALEQPVVEIKEEEKELVGEALELQRGLLISPEKNSGRGKRFVRNGLAERAQRLMGRSSTALTLWQKEMEPRISASRLDRLRPDLRVRVTRIHHVSRVANVHSRAAGTPRSVLALCQILDANAAPTEDSERTILFSFAPEGNDSPFVGPGIEVSEGIDVFVWRPWLELGPLKGKEDSASLPSTPPNSRACLDLPSRQEDAPTLLCFRFLVLHSSSES